MVAVLPADAPPEQPPEPKEEPKEEPRVIKRLLHKPGDLLIDQPLVETESEPPPDTTVLAAQNRRVDIETQTRRRTLAAQREARRRRAQDTARDKEPPRDDTTQDAHKADAKGNPDARKPAQPAEDKALVPQPEEPSRGRKAQRSGRVGSPDEPGEVAPEPEQGGDEAAGEPGAQAIHQGDAGGGAKVDVEAALQIDPGMYEEMFGARDASDKKRLDGVELRLLGRWQKRAAATRAALENLVPKVRYGNHIAINSRKSAYAAWVAGVHRGIHRLWGMGYLRHLDLSHGMGHELSDPSLKATIEFVVDGPTGAIEEVTIVSTSGAIAYDSEAIRVVYAVAPTQPAPQEVQSPDGKVYVHWTFWRDTRQCGTFGVSIYKLNPDGRLDEFEVVKPVDDLGRAH